ncbi:hypothetical protein [Tessaracoccus antarcticus]|uniref:Uncharacterized protein n=1 Tax=Tessaracoccus antarcticus TaxID=2479848 RepID=A0A3M0GI31_9ACTN|nr:hypothetical protein [Tessaracoccus antarcticus]RMB61253.1 hypothetical protein EAX62_00845 [Tessaracoccus antarcticus]
MSVVTFSNIRRSRKGRLDVSVDEDGDSSELYFDLGVRHKPADDVVALALALLVGSKYQTIVYEGIEAPVECRETIEKISRGKVELKERGSRPHRVGKRSVLAFSGGFDSLAAVSMMPPRSKRFSFDFGGKFARERPFFERFDTTIVETNLVDEGFNRHHWEFMLAGAILLNDHFRIDHLATGGVFGLAALDLMKNSRTWDTPPSAAQEYLGITPYFPVRGLTEAGTAAIVHHRYPHLLADSLTSLANPKEGKYTRKILMMRAYQASLGRTELWPDIPTAGPWYVWGKSFTEDFVSMFMIKHLGVEPVQASYRNPIPDEAVAAAKDLSLDFYLKVFPEQMWGKNNDLAHRVFETALAAGMGIYGRSDFRELEQVVTMLYPQGSETLVVR